VNLTFDRSAAGFVLMAIHEAHGVDLRCESCHGDITPDNFAGAVRGKLYCNQLPCLLRLKDLVPVDGGRKA
jgi:hypothetical protein